MKSIMSRGERLNMEVKKKVVGYITAGFGLVAGLAWNDAIRTFIEEFFPKTQNTIAAKFIYAFFITIILVIISIYLVKILRIREEEKKK